MFKSVFAVCVALCSFELAVAEDKDTTRTMVDVSLTLSQSAYSDNWGGGDVGNLSWISIANLSKQVYPHNIWHWRNTLNLAYGQTHSQDLETKNWRRPVKSTDKVDFESLVRYLRWNALPPYAAFRLQSQFQDATVTGHSLYFNPILLTESAGLTRQIFKKGNDEVLTRAGLALRELIQRSFADSTFDRTTSETSTDGGIEWVTDAAYKIPGSVIVYRSKLSTFKALYFSKSDELKGLPSEDYWKAIDVNWENSFSAQVSKYIVVALYLQWLYDKEFDLAGRFKETLSVGVAWKNL